MHQIHLPRRVLRLCFKIRIFNLPRSSMWKISVLSAWFLVIGLPVVLRSGAVGLVSTMGIRLVGA